MYIQFCWKKIVSYSIKSKNQKRYLFGIKKKIKIENKATTVLVCIHEQFYCQNSKDSAKDETCPICKKKYTHNGLKKELFEK